VNKYTKENMERVGIYTKGGFMDGHRGRWTTLSEDNYGRNIN
jgi:hypothetical protein